jgi:hypothetical protein
LHESHGDLRCAKNWWCGENSKIDKSKFGKWKYHKGARREGQWIFGGVEQGNVNHMFLVSMPDRTKETLMNLIFQHIERGTRIISDVGRAMILGN